MVGSNFPVDGLYSTLGDLYDAFDTITSDFTNQERVGLFASTACSFHQIDWRSASPDSRPVVS